jgi:thymidine phosphorylase
VHEVAAEKTGIISAIDNYQMSRIARLAGAPLDKGAGVDLLKKVGDSVEKGELLYRMYAQFPADFCFGKDQIAADSGYQIGASVNESELLPEF